MHAAPVGGEAETNICRYAAHPSSPLATSAAPYSSSYTLGELVGKVAWNGINVANLLQRAAGP
jgi:hypothetical protein